MHRLGGTVAVISIAVGALLSVVTPAAGVTPQRAVELINEQRAASGIPGDLVLDKKKARGCFRHAIYTRHEVNLLHDEDPKSPYHTPLGRTAGQSSVLGGAQFDWEFQNYWEQSPIHLAALLEPQITHLGIYAASPGEPTGQCGWTGGVRTPPAVPQVYTYPGNGVTGFYRAMQTGEIPMTPGQAAGLPGDAITGPYIYAFLHGEVNTALNEIRHQMRLVDVALTGPSGPVAVRWIDSTALVDHGIWVPAPMGYIVPEQPLEPNATYTGQLAFSGLGLTYPHTFSFTTGTEELTYARHAQGLGDGTWPGKGDFPQTKIRKGPARSSADTTPKVTMRSDEAGAGFVCRLDGKTWKLCKSPAKFRVRKAGKHEIEIAAQSADDGAIDPSPARAAFRIRKK